MSKTIESLTLGKDVNQSKTVITNNINLGKEEFKQIENRYIPPNPYENATNEVLISSDFINKFSKIVVNMLTINDLKLVAQLVDLSGKIIFNVEELRELISLFLNCPINLVSINLLPVEPHGCFGKYSPYRYINNIKIDQRDFRLLYNQHYNYLTDEYKICLEKIISF